MNLISVKGSKTCHDKILQNVKEEERGRGMEREGGGTEGGREGVRE